MHQEEVDHLIETRGERDITLESSEGDEFVVSSQIAFQSPMIMQALGEDSDQNHMKLNRVRGEVLKKVVEFITHHATVEQLHEIPNVLEEQTFDQVRVIISPALKSLMESFQIIKIEWYRVFMNNMETNLRFELLAAANYLLIKPLIDIICLFAAYQVSGKSVEEVCV